MNVLRAPMRYQVQLTSIEAELATQYLGKLSVRTIRKHTNR